MTDGNDDERDNGDLHGGDGHGEDEAGEYGDSHGEDGDQRLAVLIGMPSRIRQATVICSGEIRLGTTLRQLAEFKGGI